MSRFVAWLDELFRRLLFLPDQASTQALEVDRLQFFEFTVTTIVLVGICATMAFFAWRYRRRPGGPARTPRVLVPLRWEFGVYGAILAVFLLFWVLGIRQYLEMGRPPQESLLVYATGKQWIWKFAYPNGADSAGVLYVPAGTPVRLLLTSRDVLHSFFIPDFRIKRDVVPGRYTGLWFEAPEPGRHRVFCAEMCGTGHAKMLAEVVVLRPQEFQAWLDGAVAAEVDPEGLPRLTEQGRQVAAAHGCVACHSFDGSQRIGPTWKGVFGSVVEFEDGSRRRVDEAYLTESMMDPMAQVLKGFSPVMPSYQGQIDATETAALVELIKSLGPAASGPVEDVTNEMESQ